MANTLSVLGYAKSLTAFQTALSAGEADEYSIVFIEDVGAIYTRGSYYRFTDVQTTLTDTTSAIDTALSKLVLTYSEDSTNGTTLYLAKQLDDGTYEALNSISINCDKDLWGGTFAQTNYAYTAIRNAFYEDSGASFTLDFQAQTEDDVIDHVSCITLYDEGIDRMFTLRIDNDNYKYLFWLTNTSYGIQQKVDSNYYDEDTLNLFGVAVTDVVDWEVQQYISSSISSSVGTAIGKIYSTTLYAPKVVYSSAIDEDSATLLGTLTVGSTAYSIYGTAATSSDGTSSTVSYSSLWGAGDTTLPSDTSEGWNIGKLSIDGTTYKINCPVSFYRVLYGNTTSTTTAVTTTLCFNASEETGDIFLMGGPGITVSTGIQSAGLYFSLDTDWVKEWLGDKEVVRFVANDTWSGVSLGVLQAGTLSQNIVIPTWSEIFDNDETAATQTIIDIVNDAIAADNIAITFPNNTFTPNYTDGTSLGTLVSNGTSKVIYAPTPNLDVSGSSTSNNGLGYASIFLYTNTAKQSEIRIEAESETPYNSTNGELIFRAQMYVASNSYNSSIVGDEVSAFGVYMPKLDYGSLLSASGQTVGTLTLGSTSVDINVPHLTYTNSIGTSNKTKIGTLTFEDDTITLYAPTSITEFNCYYGTQSSYTIDSSIFSSEVGPDYVSLFIDFDTIIDTAVSTAANNSSSALYKKFLRLYSISAVDDSQIGSVTSAWGLGLGSTYGIGISYDDMPTSGYSIGTWTVGGAVGDNDATQTRVLYASTSSSSDKNLKDNITTINEDSLANADNIVFKQFNFKDKETTQYGVIAQEVQEAGFEDLVSTIDKANGYLGVEYNSIFALKIARLEQLVSALTEKVSALESTIAELTSSSSTDSSSTASTASDEPVTADL